jgi:recombination protein RecR
VGSRFPSSSRGSDRRSMSAIEELERAFGRLPGIGSRTASRLVHHLLRGPREDVRRLARALDAVAERVRPCARCGTWTETELCAICSDGSGFHRRLRGGRGPSRCTPSTGPDGSGGGSTCWGAASPLWTASGRSPWTSKPSQNGCAPRPEAGEEGIREVILATSPSVEGEATAVYLEGVLRPLGVRVTRLARGLPVGSDLEYVDGSTLAEALTGRREMGGARGVRGRTRRCTHGGPSEEEGHGERDEALDPGSRRHRGGRGRGRAVAALLVKDQIRRQQRNLFHPSALRRMAALEHVSRQKVPSVDRPEPPAGLHRVGAAAAASEPRPGPDGAHGRGGHGERSPGARRDGAAPAEDDVVTP